MSRDKYNKSELRKIIHIDMDAFYASVEQHDNSDLRNKPVIVGGSPQGRGVVAACSYEARAYGIHSAMSAAKAIKRCPQAIFVKPRMYRYKEISKAVMEIFRTVTPAIEQLSVDEAFIDVTSVDCPKNSATLLAKDICQKVYTKTGLTASAGISYNKFLAKVASGLQKPKGISTISPERAEEFIAKLPIGKFYGVGKVTEKKMFSLGITTGADLRQHSLDMLCKHFGKAGNFYFNIARGIDDRPVQPFRERKSYGTEITLKEDTNDQIVLYNILKAQSDELECHLAKNRLEAFTIHLKVKYNDFNVATRCMSLAKPVSLSAEIMANLPIIIRRIDLDNKPIRLIGISLSRLESIGQHPRQLQLPFEKQNIVDNIGYFFNLNP